MNHKRITKLGTFFILAMVVILSGTMPAAAQAERIYFSGEDCPIYMGPPDRQWVSDDGILHMRGGLLITKVTNDQTTGLNYLVVDVDVDLATGARHVYGSFELQPDIGDGTWVGRFSTHVSAEGVIDGLAVAQGTGDFEGMKTFNHISSPEAPDPACFNQNTASNGYILIP